MNDPKQLLADADEHWSEGRLHAARELYANLAANSWHAAFQTAWIDAAFGPVDNERLDALDLDDLSEDERDLLEILVERVHDREPDEILPEALANWDIDALRTNPVAKEYTWWEQCGDRAIATGQWGLAEACFDEARELKPELYYDPPARVHGLLADIEGHLEIVRR